jgi:dihydropteroate synthase
LPANTENAEINAAQTMTVDLNNLDTLIQPTSPLIRGAQIHSTVVQIRYRAARVRALRAVPPRRAGLPVAALLWRASGASATWSPPEIVPHCFKMLRAPPGLRILGRRGVAHSIHLLPVTPLALFLYDCPCVFHRKKFRLRLPSRTLLLGERTLLMGVLNVTPDSFSDGGAFLDPQAAVARALELERDGADILDIGGESTRPAAAPVSAREEISRILPLFEALRGKLRIPISVDTQKAEVAEAALAAGAEIVNDISALRTDPRLGEVARHARAPVILMHMRGAPRTMQQGLFARDVIRDVMAGLREALARVRRAGLAKSQILLDPGIGFGKSHEQNFEILARLPEFARLGCPIVIGTSRKAFLGKALAKPGESPVPPRERILGTAATVTASILGGAHIVRVHDVAEIARVVRVADAIRTSC